MRTQWGSLVICLLLELFTMTGMASRSLTSSFYLLLSLRR